MKSFTGCPLLMSFCELCRMKRDVMRLHTPVPWSYTGTSFISLATGSSQEQGTLVYLPFLYFIQVTLLGSHNMIGVCIVIFSSRKISSGSGKISSRETTLKVRESKAKWGLHEGWVRTSQRRRKPTETIRTVRGKAWNYKNQLKHTGVAKGD